MTYEYEKHITAAVVRVLALKRLKRFFIHFISDAVFISSVWFAPFFRGTQCKANKFLISAMVES